MPRLLIFFLEPVARNVYYPAEPRKDPYVADMEEKLLDPAALNSKPMDGQGRSVDLMNILSPKLVGAGFFLIRNCDSYSQDFFHIIVNANISTI